MFFYSMFALAGAALLALILVILAGVVIDATREWVSSMREASRLVSPPESLLPAILAFVVISATWGREVVKDALSWLS